MRKNKQNSKKKKTSQTKKYKMEARVKNDVFLIEYDGAGKYTLLHHDERQLVSDKLEDIKKYIWQMTRSRKKIKIDVIYEDEKVQAVREIPENITARNLIVINGEELYITRNDEENRNTVVYMAFHKKTKKKLLVSLNKNLLVLMLIKISKTKKWRMIYGKEKKTKKK